MSNIRLCRAKADATRSISKYHFQMIFFEIKRDSYASAGLSPPLSLYHLLSKFANSLDAEDLRRLAKPNQGQTGIPRINNASDLASVILEIHFSEKGQCSIF